MDITYYEQLLNNTDFYKWATELPVKREDLRKFISLATQDQAEPDTVIDVYILADSIMELHNNGSLDKTCLLDILAGVWYTTPKKITYKKYVRSEKDYVICPYPWIKDRSVITYGDWGIWKTYYSAQELVRDGYVEWADLLEE